MAFLLVHTQFSDVGVGARGCAPFLFFQSRAGTAFPFGEQLSPDVALRCKNYLALNSTGRIIGRYELSFPPLPFRSPSGNISCCVPLVYCEASGMDWSDASQPAFAGCDRRATVL